MGQWLGCESVNKTRKRVHIRLKIALLNHACHQWMDSHFLQKGQSTLKMIRMGDLMTPCLCNLGHQLFVNILFIAGDI